MIAFPAIFPTEKETKTFVSFQFLNIGRWIVNAPETNTVFFAVPATAEVNAASEVTVTVEPPTPPVVPVAKPISAVSDAETRFTSPIEAP
jgi:hypothetical protein